MGEAVADGECAIFDAEQYAMAAKNERLLWSLPHGAASAQLLAFAEPMLAAFRPGRVVFGELWLERRR